MSKKKSTCHEVDFLNILYPNVLLLLLSKALSEE